MPPDDALEGFVGDLLQDRDHSASVVPTGFAELDGTGCGVSRHGEDPIGAAQRVRDGAPAQVEARQQVEVAAAHGDRDGHAKVRRQQDRRRTVGEGVVGVDDVEGKVGTNAPNVREHLQIQNHTVGATTQQGKRGVRWVRDGQLIGRRCGR